jgi:hypothetical protein
VVDAGYDVPRLAYQLRDLPVVVLGRLRSDRVLYRAAPPYAGIGRPQRHGAAFRLTDPSTWETPEIAPVTDTDRYGKFELIIAAFTQLAAAKSLAADLRLPWEAPAVRGRLTPARVRRAFPDLHANLPRLTSVPKPSKPGPGRPAGQRNRRKAPIRDPGKKAKRDKTLAQRKQRLTSARA